MILSYHLFNHIVLFYVKVLKKFSEKHILSSTKFPPQRLLINVVLKKKDSAQNLLKKVGAGKTTSAGHY